MTKFKVVKTNLLHEGTVYPVGSSIELNDEQAAKLQHYLERQYEPDNKAYQDQADTTHEDYEDMTISELKSWLNKRTLKSFRPVQVDAYSKLITLKRLNNREGCI
ncbi:hypothetical protein [Staphylococcus simulans]|uniref:hypothetical protein n=1 Tax=Staphylococcus simulans TaxID=1286 RepID=UPI003CEB11B8